MTIRFTDHGVEKAEKFSINVYENGASIGGAISLVLNNNGTVAGEGIIHDNNSDQDISVYVEGYTGHEVGNNRDFYTNVLKLHDKDTGAEVLNLSNNRSDALNSLVNAYSDRHVYLFGEYHDLDGNVTGGVVAEFGSIFD